MGGLVSFSIFPSHHELSELKSKSSSLKPAPSTFPCCLLPPLLQANKTYILSSSLCSASPLSQAPSICSNSLHHAFRSDHACFVTTYTSSQRAGERCPLHNPLTAPTVPPSFRVPAATRLKRQHISGTLSDFRKLCWQRCERL